ncbi:smoothelin-like protein 2 [Exaiptasia diaphana]|uniref:Calponin-homology (CH) domain-containing protein n=1 Tax=Exaiptasia diaphana TaxID=2652724 RepID=A0A913WSE1_EXADI|nr:smoothelin-like protein 2 [Exaiptasia diaphana]KXJ18412.1 Smoothelin-like protein 2 [Exaiptasia diaphana]
MAHKRGSVADRMAFFRKAIEEEKKMNSRGPRRPVSADFSNNNFPGSYRPRWQPPSQLQMQKEKQEKQEKLENEKPIEGASTQQQEQPEIKERKTEKVVSQRKEPRVLKKKPELKRQMSVSSVVLTWCQDVTKGYKGVDIKNFSGSFTSGLAFCALIHKFNPDKFDYDALEPENREYNVRLAFRTGVEVGIPELLTADEFLRMGRRPEPRSVQCYIQMIFSKYKPKDLDMSNLRIA